MNVKEKNILLQKEAASLNIDSLQKSLDLLLKTNGDIIHSLYESKPNLDIGEVYIETLMFKILFTSNSILHLSHGTDYSTIKHSKIAPIIDRSSLYILTRSVIEAFLTLEYLYFNDLSREEQIFRYNLWRISGFQSRQIYTENLNPKLAEKLKNEKIEIENLKSEIQKSEYYSNLKNQDLWKLDNYGLPRIMSWSKLLQSSVLKNPIFEKIYGLYSNYAHSEFIAMIQINEGKYGKFDEFNIETTTSTLNIIRILNCTSILLFTERFDCAKDVFNKLDEKIKFTIEFWKTFGGKH